MIDDFRPDPSPLRQRYDLEVAEAEKLYHDGWYGSPTKRPPSKPFLENFDKIKWDKGINSKRR